MLTSNKWSHHLENDERHAKISANYRQANEWWKWCKNTNWLSSLREFGLSTKQQEKTLKTVKQKKKVDELIVQKYTRLYCSIKTLRAATRRLHSRNNASSTSRTASFLTQFSNAHVLSLIGSWTLGRLQEHFTAGLRFHCRHVRIPCDDDLKFLRQPNNVPNAVSNLTQRFTTIPSPFHQDE